MFRNVLERAVSCLVILGLSIESFVIIRNILDYQAYLILTDSCLTSADSVYERASLKSILDIANNYIIIQ